MSMEKDGYEVVTDTSPSADDLKKAKRRMGLICANSREIMVSGFDPMGAKNDRNPAVPLRDGSNFYDD